VLSSSSSSSEQSTIVTARALQLRYACSITCIQLLTHTTLSKNSEQFFSARFPPSHKSNYSSLQCLLSARRGERAAAAPHAHTTIYHTCILAKQLAVTWHIHAAEQREGVAAEAILQYFVREHRQAVVREYYLVRKSCACAVVISQKLLVKAQTRLPQLTTHTLTQSLLPPLAVTHSSDCGHTRGASHAVIHSCTQQQTRLRLYIHTAVSFKWAEGTRGVRKQ
jgi:hypothetical protein